MKKYFTYSGLILVFIVGIFLVIFKTPLSEKVLPKKYLTLEQIVRVDNEALLKNDPYAFWEDMNPDDKLRFKDKEEYAQIFNMGSETYKSITLKEIKPLTKWSNPITDKTYNNVREVVSSYVQSDPQKPIDISYVYSHVMVQ